MRTPRCPSWSALLVAAVYCTACGADVLLGEQRHDADVRVEDADVDVADADDDADDADDDDVEADVDGEDQMTCYQAMFCLVACGEDLLCAAGCSAQVCEPSVAPLNALSDCALPLCAPECVDFAASACQTCVFEHCSTLVGPCVGAGC